MGIVNGANYIRGVPVRLLFLLCLLVISSSIYASCPPVDWDETVILKRINDGDTVTLENDRLVRFIGIDTPEINYRDLSKSESYASQAKALLAQYIRPGDKLHLVYDKTKQDKYGRKLAYVYSKTGRNLALLQLQAGYAHHWVIGKNDKFWRCFHDAQEQARLAKKALWADFTPLSAGNLRKSDKGYHYISGTITSRQEYKGGLQLMLDSHLFVSISKANRHLFSDSGIDFQLHNSVLLSGKLVFSQSKPKLRLYHPAQILK